MKHGAFYQLFGILFLKTNKKHTNDRKHICHVDLLSTACTFTCIASVKWDFRGRIRSWLNEMLSLTSARDCILVPDPNVLAQLFYLFAYLNVQWFVSACAFIACTPVMFLCQNWHTAQCFLNKVLIKQTNCGCCIRFERRKKAGLGCTAIFFQRWYMTLQEGAWLVRRQKIKTDTHIQIRISYPQCFYDCAEKKGTNSH